MATILRYLLIDKLYGEFFMKKRVYTKIAILLYATIMSQTLLAYETRTVSNAIYSEYMQKYPLIIIDKQTDMHLTNLRSDLEDDDLLTGFLMKKTADSYIIDIYQDNYQDVDSLFQITLTTVEVSKSVVMYVYSNNYLTPLKVYDQPNTDKIKNIFTEYIDVEIYVIDFSGKWLLVTFVYKGHQYVGWLSPNSYCSNPYTTCN